MQHLLKRVGFFGLAMLVILAAAIGWSFLIFGLIAEPYAFFVNFVGWVAVGLLGQSLTVKLAKHLKIWP